ncbi:helix-turn-helix domain-containing protein [Curtobacterium sp. MCSS17_005]|uniref:helix-turn-helix domain-containing protein n=1 Tax=Curtobacterium sp. MCSS17_005 TaxID=2175641 RepID=UPI000DA9095E|nr:helix-turn-helix domain-containing protein [Curtobacterium sp. MCSS17_005]WIB34368.1 helix-turn-helix domain-containing protein [Curtobacterium sp. MCSS17_005]
MTDPFPEGPAGECVVVAVAFMHVHVGRPVTVGEIAAAANVTAHELHQQFRHQMGASPLQHFRRLRLDGVHAGLHTARTAAAVRELVRQWEFVHYGRFSAAYTARFGETPNISVDRSS